jgi:hypothetical protein
VGNTGSAVRQADVTSAGGAGTGNRPPVDGDLTAGISVTTDSTELSQQKETGPGMATVPAMRVSTDVTGGMGSDTGDEQGIGSGADMDPSIARGDMASTGTPQQAGLGGPSSGNSMDVDPAAGSGMANPADMGDQG